MLLRAWDFPQEVDLWLKVGGRETLASYPDSRFAELHSEFLRDRCVDFFETETHIFVHGGVDPDLPMSMQPVPTLRWKTFRDPKPHVSGKIVVCGHTPQQDGLPHNLGHSICLDTGAGARSGWLTCLDINSNQIIQANQNGEIRFAELPPAHGKRLPLRSNDALP
jgi:serine/threonine protein phosphatase 1